MAESVVPSPKKESFRAIVESAETNKESFKTKNKSAFVVGWTGEVGKELVKQLAKTKVFQRVVLIGRRNVEYTDPDLMELEQKVVDFDCFDEFGDALNGLEVGFCCLGTTKYGKNGQNFVRVEHDYVMNTAKLALSGGCREYHIVTSIGANPKSPSLYLKVKGQVEEELKQLDFHHLSIYRPAVLLCNRQENRPKDAMLQFVARPFAKCFPTAATVPTEVVAKAMLNNAVAPHTEKVQIFENKAIHAVGGNLKKSKSGKR